MSKSTKFSDADLKKYNDMVGNEALLSSGKRVLLEDFDGQKFFATTDDGDELFIAPKNVKNVIN